MSITPADTAEERAILGELRRHAILASIATREDAARLAAGMVAARKPLPLYVQGLGEYAAAVIRGDEPVDAARADVYGLRAQERFGGAGSMVVAAMPAGGSTLAAERESAERESADYAARVSGERTPEGRAALEAVEAIARGEFSPSKQRPP